MDDDTRIREMTADALRDNGHDVEEADCGATALANRFASTSRAAISRAGRACKAIYDIRTARGSRRELEFLGETVAIGRHDLLAEEVKFDVHNATAAI